VAIDCSPQIKQMIEKAKEALKLESI